MNAYKSKKYKRRGKLQKTPAFTICSCVARHLLAGLARMCCQFIGFVQLKKTFKQIKILPSLRSKMSSEITSNDPRLLIFHLKRKISSFNSSTGRSILTFCTERQNCQTHVLDATLFHRCHQDAIRRIEN